MNEFERKLQRQPLRQIPPQWRNEILSAAREADPQNATPKVRPWIDRLRELLWPCSQAWAGLAAMWILTLALHLVTPPSVHIVANTISPGRSDSATAFAESRQFLSQILELPPTPTPATEPRKPPVPGPRSERRHEIKVA